MNDINRLQPNAPQAPESRKESATQSLSEELRSDLINGDADRQHQQQMKIKSQMNAINNSMAYIEFDKNGNILDANENFLKVMKYHLVEIKGKHHQIFCDATYVQSPEYRQFWEELRSGSIQTNEFKRIAKDGSVVWIQASYSPVTDENGAVTGVIKIASDITETKVASMNNQRQLEESYRTQAVIEFTNEGYCLDANENFCSTVGYRLDEIKGQHHRMFVDPAYSESAEYRRFWSELNDGKFQTAEFKRFGKGGKEVWIQATYNPMFDVTGKVNRVVKFASDITQRKRAEQREKELMKAIEGTLEQVDKNTDTLSSSSEELASVANQMTSNSRETAEQAGSVASAAEQVSGNVSNVATSSEELSASVKEISRNAQNAAKVGNKAVDVAKQANHTIAELGNSSQEIGKVIKSITSIAQKTNLLALNATIEAARAGDAGKGFAVVANEVKELARQTASATEDISQKIEAIQDDTKDAVQAIDEIRKIINEINDNQNTIATAVEEQTATVHEVARNAGEAAKGSNDIAKNITKVSQGAESTTEGASQTLEAAKELARLSGELKSIVEDGKRHKDQA